MGRQATCAFVVALRHRPLAFTRYLAFGDSMTAGENGRPDGFRTFIDLPNAYPTFLQQFLNDRLPGQQVTVINAGRSGEKAADSDPRLKDEMAKTQAEVLLLLEGINDLNGGASPQALVNILRDSIRTAKDRGARYVFVSTLLPVAPENCGSPIRCRALDTPPNAITSANDGIRSMVPANGAVLVDPYDTFNANRKTFIDLDGLHLLPEGNRALANAFLERIFSTVPAQQLRGF
jgi:lysophospholipase L1-like esterase